MTETKNKLKNEKKPALLILSVLLLAIYCNSIYAMPVPHGIDGIIYELDGITQVPAGISFSVNDSNTGQMIYGSTGYGSSGGYSVSLDGDNGDIIVIKAWNRVNSVNRTVTLEGVMGNVNLLLNMSIPNAAPNITSTPITNATQDATYIYNVTASDLDGDSLTYYLISYPSGMVIGQASGLIVWEPTKYQTGNNNISVMASDGESNSTQNFTINVANVNDAPVILSDITSILYEGTTYQYNLTATDIDNDNLTYYLIASPDGMTINSTSGILWWTPTVEQYGYHQISIGATDGHLTDTRQYVFLVEIVNDAPVIVSTPLTSAKAGVLYKYNVSATEPDYEVVMYSLLINPDGMSIDSGTGEISWIPNGNQLGENSVSVQVTDGELSDTQSFNITVGVNPSDMVVENTGSTGSLGQAGASPLGTDIIDVAAKNKDGTAAAVIVRQYNERPKDAQTISRLVYKYFEIIKEDGNDISYASIKFKVEKKWLEDRGLSKEDIIMARYNSGNKIWEDIPTAYLSEDHENIIYESKTPGFSYFAITIKEESLAKAIESSIPTISKINAPYRIAGIIYEGSIPNQINGRTILSLRNSDTNQTTYAKTGILGNTGAYIAYVYGKIGDTIEISVSGCLQPYLIKLNGDVDRLNLVLDRKTGEIKEANSPQLQEGKQISWKPEKMPLITTVVISIITLVILLTYTRINKFIYTRKKKNGKKRYK